MSTRTDYYEKLKDPRWQKRRLEIMQKRGWKCESCTCGEKDGRQFHVHHLYYVSGRSPWSYPDWAFAVLCDPCHWATHEAIKILDEPQAWEKIIDGFFEGRIDPMHPRFMMAFSHSLDDWLESERQRKITMLAEHKRQAEAAGIQWEPQQ